MPVTFAFNSTEELALADTIGATGLVRVFQAAWTVASQNAAFSQLAQVQNPWALASSTSLPAFSATAWYTAKALFLERQGANANVPLGIVVSTWPGVPIKPWTTVATNEKCMPLYPLNETHADCGMFHWRVCYRPLTWGLSAVCLTSRFCSCAHSSLPIAYRKRPSHVSLLSVRAGPATPPLFTTA